MGVDCNFCQKKCFGVEGFGGSCCTIEDRDWIIGPISDPGAFLERLRVSMPGVEINWVDVFIDYEEGRNMFPEKTVWQNSNNYPALRVDTTRERKPCVFYNMALHCCSVYGIRPEICKNYLCEFLKSQKV